MEMDADGVLLRMPPDPTSADNSTRAEMREMTRTVGGYNAATKDISVGLLSDPELFTLPIILPLPLYVTHDAPASLKRVALAGIARDVQPKPPGPSRTESQW